MSSSSLTSIEAFNHFPTDYHGGRVIGIKLSHVGSQLVPESDHKVQIHMKSLSIIKSYAY